MKTLALIAALGLVAAPAFANEAPKADAKGDKVVAGEAKKEEAAKEAAPAAGEAKKEEAKK